MTLLHWIIHLLSFLAFLKGVQCADMQYPLPQELDDIASKRCTKVKWEYLVMVFFEPQYFDMIEIHLIYVIQKSLFDMLSQMTRVIVTEDLDAANLDNLSCFLWNTLKGICKMLKLLLHLLRENIYEDCLCEVLIFMFRFCIFICKKKTVIYVFFKAKM